MKAYATLALFSIAAVVARPALSSAGDRIWLDEMDISRMSAGWGAPRAKSSVEGNALSIGGVKYERGVGTHAASSYKIVLGGNALSFSAMAGVDDEVQARKGEWRGSVVFRVYADGRLVAEASSERGRAVPIHADLAGAKIAVLAVTDAGDGDTFDHADWADAFFVFKSGTKPCPPSALTRQLGILTPKPAAAPRINAPARYGVRPGRPVLFKLPATGAKPLKIAAKTVDGLVFDADKRTLAGSLASPGEYTVAFSAENAYGRDEKRVVFVAGDKLALTPPMGWNSWNAFSSQVTPEKMKTAADKFVELGLDEHGYSYVNIDDFWQRSPKGAEWDKRLGGAERNPDGTISPNDRFTDMKGLADYIHSKGLKAGLYSSPGPYTCGGCTGSWLHELQDAKSYAEWGYDYLKYDWCSYGGVATGSGRDRAMRPYLLMGRFLKMQPRDIVFSLCQYGMEDVSTWGELVDGHCWRTTGDIFDTWQSVYGGIRAQVKNWMFARPGAWNDADMLVLGRNVWAGKGAENGDSRLTPNEQYTHMSMWCMLASPLMIGCDLANIDEFTLSLLTNDEVLAVDQDELGAAAALIVEDVAARTEIWARPLADGSMAFALLNADDEEQKIRFDFAALGISGKWRVRDLWRQSDEGVFSHEYGVSVPGHATHMARLFPLEGAKLKPCLKDIRDNAWRLPFDADRREARKAAGEPCADCP